MYKDVRSSTKGNHKGGQPQGIAPTFFRPNVINLGCNARYAVTERNQLLASYNKFVKS